MNLKNVFNAVFLLGGLTIGPKSRRPTGCDIYGNRSPAEIEITI